MPSKPTSAPGGTLTGRPARFAKGLAEIGDGVWAWLQPNGAWGEANAGLVAGDDEALLVDTLWDERLAAEMLLAMQPVLEGRPIRTVVNTHSDGDHWWGNHQVPPAAEIVTSAASRSTMEEESGPGELARLARTAALAGRLPGPLRPLGRYVGAMLAPFDFAGVTPRCPDRTFSGAETLTAGGREVRLIEVGPAHTPGDAIVVVPDAGVVFAADVLFVGATPVMWHGPLEGWIRALDVLLGQDAEVFVPGHGPVSGRAEVQDLRDYMTWIGQVVADEHALGRTATEAARALVRSREFDRWRDWENPERILITATTVHRALGGDEPVGGSPAARARLFHAVGRFQRELPR